MYFRPDMRSSQDVKEFALCGMEGLVGGGMEGRAQCNATSGEAVEQVGRAFKKAS